MTSSKISTVTIADVEAAAGRLKGKAVRTPILTSPALDERVGGRILIKPEILQRTGSFKFRGAYNKISSLPEDAREKGVLAYSSGNHAQGVALAAKLLGIPATIIMPADAPAIKVANTKGYGAQVIHYDRFGESREVVAEKILSERGSYLVKPYDDPFVIAGQGTVGLEIAEQSAELGTPPDAVLACCGGGGLTAGVATAVTAKIPGAKMHLVEPAGFDDTARSLVSGRWEKNDPAARSICDALLSPEPGKITLPINQELVTSGIAVTDDEVRLAMAYAFKVLKLVVEPGGAVTLAALLAGKIDCRDRTLAIILSGGNVDWERTEEALRSAAV
ncbi:threonine ammonia-lyase [Limibacillus halophilus]|jgi:threonine dehydratase